MNRENFNNIMEELLEKILLNKGKFIGAALGFIFGILFLVVGFFKTFILLVCTLIGYYVGSRWDIEGDLKKFIDRILPPQLK